MQVRVAQLGVDNAADLTLIVVDHPAACRPRRAISHVLQNVVT